VAKHCEIGPKLLLITNRKSHIGFQVTQKSLTLDDLKGLNSLWCASRAVFWLMVSRRELPMVPSDRVLATSYRLSIITKSLSAAVWTQFSIEGFKP